MEVSKHDIGAPSTDELNDARVDAAAKKCHGAPGAAEAGRDVGGKETELGPQHGRGNPDGFRDQAGAHTAPYCPSRAADGAQGGVRGSIMGP
jgi:hypothetical protein